MTEIEPAGVTYERMAFDRLHARLARNYGWQTALEAPAHGVKAAPSLYSLGLARAGVRVTLEGGDPQQAAAFARLGLQARVTFAPPSLAPGSAESALPYPAGAFDLAWNFAALPLFDDPLAALRELGRVARFVMIAGVNGWNYGFPLHRLAHALTRTPWTHGAVRLHYPAPVRQLMKQAGLRPLETGVLDCPPWPDSPGLRDIRLHRHPPGARQWQVPALEYLQTGFPAWMERIYRWLERPPLPHRLRLPYAHLFYVVAAAGRSDSNSFKRG
mgnify:CR=1 FL=1